MEATSLRLLASDGPFRVTFRPALTSDQYAELLELTQTEPTARTMHELCKLFASAAERWGVAFDSDGMCAR